MGNGVYLCDSSGQPIRLLFGSSLANTKGLLHFKQLQVHMLRVVDPPPSGLQHVERSKAASTGFSFFTFRTEGCVCKGQVRTVSGSGLSVRHILGCFSNIRHESRETEGQTERKREQDRERNRERDRGRG